MRKMEAEYGFRASAIRSGEEATTEYRVFFRNQAGAKISPWHSIPLFADKGLLHVVCEIPAQHARQVRGTPFPLPLPLFPPLSSFLMLRSHFPTLSPSVAPAAVQGTNSQNRERKRLE